MGVCEGKVGRSVWQVNEEGHEETEDIDLSESQIRSETRVSRGDEGGP